MWLGSPVKLRRLCKVETEANMVLYCESCDWSVKELKEVVDEWAEQWKLITDDRSEADGSPDAGRVDMLFHRAASDIARRFYSLSDLIGVDDLFMEHALALTETYDKDFIAIISDV